MHLGACVQALYDRAVQASPSDPDAAAAAALFLKASQRGAEKRVLSGRPAGTTVRRAPTRPQRGAEARAGRGARGAGRGARGAGRGVALSWAGVERWARVAGGASGPGGVARSLVPRPPALLCALPPANRSWTRCRACRRLYDRPPPRPVRRGPRTRGLRAVLAIPDAFSG